MASERTTSSYGAVRDLPVLYPALNTQYQVLKLQRQVVEGFLGILTSQLTSSGGFRMHDFISKELGVQAAPQSRRQP